MATLKQSLARVPVLGYLLRLAVDLVTLPIFRSQLARDTRNHFEIAVQQDREIRALRQTIGELQQRFVDLQRELADARNEVQSTRSAQVEQLQSIAGHLLELSRDTSSLSHSQRRARGA
ncbi:MAG TPA: hypothetical protein VES20_14725 [Bryobacteraceae bacterium]|nr:hypothetical protein [Bryobacteraceae bacterium]